MRGHEKKLIINNNTCTYKGNLTSMSFTITKYYSPCSFGTS